MLLIMLFCTPALAWKTGVKASLFTGAPDFNDGPEYDSATIYQQEYTDQLRFENQQEFSKNVNEATRVLQQQADENAKWLAQAVEKGTLKQIEDKLRKQAMETGSKFDVRNDKEEWNAEYTMTTEYGVRTDTATVYHKYGKVRVVTRVQPYGVVVFSVAQITK